jgi:hypothetical protein
MRNLNVAVVMMSLVPHASFAVPPCCKTNHAAAQYEPDNAAWCEGSKVVYCELATTNGGAKKFSGAIRAAKCTTIQLINGAKFLQAPCDNFPDGYERSPGTNPNGELCCWVSIEDSEASSEPQGFDINPCHDLC